MGISQDDKNFWLNTVKDVVTQQQTVQIETFNPPKIEIHEKMWIILKLKQID